MASEQELLSEIIRLKAIVKESSPVLELIRLEENQQYGTFGLLKINKEVFCVTLEPPDIENQRNVSSIPPQQYICKRHNSATFGGTFMVGNVPNRDFVLFHAGNVKSQTQGCILLAEYFGKLKGDRAVLNSGATFTKFMEKIGDYETLHLTVTEKF